MATVRILRDWWTSISSLVINHRRDIYAFLTLLPILPYCNYLLLSPGRDCNSSTIVAIDAVPIGYQRWSVYCCDVHHDIWLIRRRERHTPTLCTTSLLPLIFRVVANHECNVHLMSCIASLSNATVSYGTRHATPVLAPKAIITACASDYH